MVTQLRRNGMLPVFDTALASAKKVKVLCRVSSPYALNAEELAVKALKMSYDWDTRIFFLVNCARRDERKSWECLKEDCSSLWASSCSPCSALRVRQVKVSCVENTHFIFICTYILSKSCVLWKGVVHRLRLTAVKPTVSITGKLMLRLFSLSATGVLPWACLQYVLLHRRLPYRLTTASAWVDEVVYWYIAFYVLTRCVINYWCIRP